MKAIKIEIFFFFCFLSLVVNAPPPVPEKLYEIKVETPSVIRKTSNNSNLFKRLDNTPKADIIIQNSKIETNIYADYTMVNHQLTLIPENLPDNSFFPEYIFYLKDKNTYEDIKANCQVVESATSCEVNKETSKEGEYNIYKFSLSFELGNTQRLIINYRHKIIKAKTEILYKKEGVIIPLISKSKNCDYKYKIIPNGYKFLGLQNNVLTKDADNDNTFIYNGECPTESKTDIIRFAPEETMWKADMSFSLTLSTEFQNSISMMIPRYYRGGKLKNSYYRIFSTQNKEFKEEKILYNYTYLNVEIPPANSKTLGIDLHTAFTNKLSEEFEINFPESFYSINGQNVDSEIKAKAQEIANDDTYYPGYPNYYKIGQFVHSHITYDLKYFGKDYTPKEIYNLQKGVCEHYTILYNEMLNAIGIKTLYLTGWAFQNDETSGNKDTIGHAWTAALINDKWMELDATWGLFEGVPAGHILKGFFKGTINFSWNEGRNLEPTYDEDRTIQMVTNENDLIDPYPTSLPDEDKTKYDSKEESKDVSKDETKDDSEDEDKDNKEGDIENYKSNFGNPSLTSLILLYLFFL